MYIYLVGLPEKKEGRLNEEQISSIYNHVSRVENEAFSSGNFFTGIEGILKEGLAEVIHIGKWVLKGEDIKMVSYENPDSIEGVSVEIIDFAEVQNVDLKGDVKEYYEKAVEDYNRVKDDYAGTSYGKIESLDEDALFNLIELSFGLNQKRTAVELCEEFEINYPNSKKPLNVCDNKIKLASFESSTESVLIGGVVKTISLEDVYNPSYEEYGVKILVEGLNGKRKEFTLKKDQTIYLNEIGRASCRERV